MASASINQKTNMAKLVSLKKLAGFSLFESLICVFIFQLICLLVWPNFLNFIQYQKCKASIQKLQHIIIDAEAQALILNQPVFIEKVDHQKWFIITTHYRLPLEFVAKDFQMSWRGFSGTLKLTFYPELLANHVNGYFDIFCARKFSFRLWLNRLGHTRLEM